MTGTLNSALYVGKVMHQRLGPIRHRLSYRLFWLLLDLDEIDALCRRLPFFSRNRPNLVAFHDRDHGIGGGKSLRGFVENTLTDAGIAVEGGAIRLLAMPRILGYAFNPLSVYFCYRRDGTLHAVVYEVHNTFGQRHAYAVAVTPSTGESSRHACAKALYVSPFLDMKLTYEFRLAGPGERLAIHITAHRDGHPALMAALSAGRRDLTGAALLKAVMRYPLETFKVMAAIHWHAFLLWVKGVRIVPRPSDTTASAGMQHKVVRRTQAGIDGSRP